MRKQRMDIKSFVYFSIFHPFSYIMNIITILITLCHKYILSSKYRDIGRGHRNKLDRRYLRFFFFFVKFQRNVTSLAYASVEILRWTQMQSFITSIPNLFLSFVGNRLIKSHLRSLSKFLKFLFSLSFSLSYQLGSRQMCAERFVWPKRSRSMSVIIEKNVRGPRKCSRYSHFFFLTTKHSNKDRNNTRRNWSMQIRYVRVCVYVLQACPLQTVLLKDAYRCVSLKCVPEAHIRKSLFFKRK